MGTALLPSTRTTAGGEINRLAGADHLVQRCMNCDAEDRRLYALARIARTGGAQVLEVCHFCYLRLAGVRPRRSDQVERERGPPIQAPPSDRQSEELA